MRKIIALLLLAFPLCVLAQRGDVVKGGCTPGLSENDGAMTRGARRSLQPIHTDWNPQKVYRQPVVLFTFADKDFSMEHPRETYDSIFNYPGYNRGSGPGCVADYFREQSGGMLNIQFDVYGPYKVTQNAKRNANANSDTQEFGTYAMLDATEKWIASDTQRQHKDYDWYGKGEVTQTIYIYAGYSGNQAYDACYGCIWPNSSQFSSYLAITTHDGYLIRNYTCSGEMRYRGNQLYGIGTICHEFTHCLGLPDIYPTNRNMGYSMVDEWDLMDGGNYIDSGWCPPNYSGLERMLMGWQSPIELTEPTTITSMKPLSEGGPVYLVRHTNSEYYLLENRQWTGWDALLPGRGLVVFHVDYDNSSWVSNMLNNNKTHRRYQLVTADNLDYDAWDAIIGDGDDRANGHNLHLSTAAYPWTTDSTDYVNDRLTDTSEPPSLMYNSNSAGSLFLSKAITNIRVSDDGLVSFDFMGGDPTGINDIKVAGFKIQECYDLQGRRVDNPQQGNLYIVRTPQGIRKRLYR